MSETSPSPLPNETGSPQPVAERRGRIRWQVGLRTLFLVIAAIACWMTVYVCRRDNALLEARIKAMVPLAHELIVDDARKGAVVKLAETWYDDNRWDLYLPDGQSMLCVATRGIDEKGLASVVKRVPMPAGRSRLALEQRRETDGWRVTVSRDGTELLTAIEPKDWDPGVGSTGGGQYSQNESFDLEKTVVLFRRRFMREVGKGRSQTPSGPTEGILLWIEPMAGSKDKR